MRIARAVIVHGLDDARAALSSGLAVTLLSAPGAALYAGAAWWRALVERARAEHPRTPGGDILDCAAAAGYALAAIRRGQRMLILSPESAAFSRVSAIAVAHGVAVLTAPPPALDLAARGALRRLPAWLDAASDPT